MRDVRRFWRQWRDAPSRIEHRPRRGYPSPSERERPIRPSLTAHVASRSCPATKAGIDVASNKCKIYQAYYKQYFYCNILSAKAKVHRGLHMVTAYDFQEAPPH